MTTTIICERGTAKLRNPSTMAEALRDVRDRKAIMRAYPNENVELRERIARLETQMAALTKSSRQMDSGPETDLVRIVKIVGEDYGAGPDQIFGARRTKNVAEARAVSIYFARLFTSLSYVEIGHCFNRNFSTAGHAFRSVRDQVEIYANFERHISQLHDKIAKELSREIGS